MVDSGDCHGNGLFCRKSPKVKSPKDQKAGKAGRKWDLSGTTKDLADLEYTKDKDAAGTVMPDYVPDHSVSDS